ncbi:AMP-binding protein [bacterium]|nr:AMP-binding protein [bacterium]
MKKAIRIFFYVISVLYPLLVFTLLVVFKLPLKLLSLCVIALAAALFLSFSAKKGNKNLDWKPLATSILFFLAGLLCFMTDEAIFLKLYPVAINLIFLAFFGSTLLCGPNIIFRFATLADKSVKGSFHEKKVENYCRKVTVIWCIFFIFNGSIAILTVFAGKIFGITPENADRIWSLYNGGISYILMGVLFAAEFIVRKFVDKKMVKVFPLTKFKASSRAKEAVVCYDGKWSDNVFKTWGDFLRDTAKMRKFLESRDTDSYILHCADFWYFGVTFTALLQCQKEVKLTQNISENFLSEALTPGVELLTDAGVENSLNIPEIIEKSDTPTENEIDTTPEINGETTRIFLFTSGSTGKPKAVPQRMKEFEEDNAFIISKWLDKIQARKFVSTVSQHHIFGFLFGFSLPFATGTPFRRKRIEFPEEFEELTDEKYLIVATPAFLKRTVEIVEKLDMHDTWIFTSGGAVSPELAVKTDRLFGIYPLEVYGSTETSGIAYRMQDKDGLVWTPFDNAKIWLGDDGCLRIISPYIKDPAGFATADMAEMLENGKFLLKGRSDSIVKIEEKRISLTEVENRLLESGLIEDVKVIALSNDIRQYLAAAVVLNEKGKNEFSGKEKLVLNRFFHDYLMKFFENTVIPKKWRFLDKLPTDIQGKKHKEEIAALFEVK